MRFVCAASVSTDFFWRSVAKKRFVVSAICPTSKSSAGGTVCNQIFLSISIYCSAPSKPRNRNSDTIAARAAPRLGKANMRYNATATKIPTTADLVHLGSI